MKIRFSRFRTFLLTLTLGFAAVSVWTRLAAYLEEVPVDVPKIQSDSPIMIRVCREPGSENEYFEGGQVYFGKEKAVNCNLKGGGAGGGFTYDERY